MHKEFDMIMTIQEIERAIEELSPVEFAQLHIWFEKFNAETMHHSLTHIPDSSGNEKNVPFQVVDYDDVL